MDAKLGVLLGLIIAAVFALAVALGVSQGSPVVPDPERAQALHALRSGVAALPGIGGGRPLEPRDLATASGCRVEGRRILFVGCAAFLPEDVDEVTLTWRAGRSHIELAQEGLVTQRFDLPADLEDRPGSDDQSLSLVVNGDQARLSLVCLPTDICAVEVPAP